MASAPGGHAQGLIPHAASRSDTTRRWSSSSNRRPARPPSSVKQMASVASAASTAPSTSPPAPTTATSVASDLSAVAPSSDLAPTTRTSSSAPTTAGVVQRPTIAVQWSAPSTTVWASQATACVRHQRRHDPDNTVDVPVDGPAMTTSSAVGGNSHFFRHAPPNGPARCTWGRSDRRTAPTDPASLGSTSAEQSVAADPHQSGVVGAQRRAERRRRIRLRLNHSCLTLQPDEEPRRLRDGVLGPPLPNGTWYFHLCTRT